MLNSFGQAYAQQRSEADVLSQAPIPVTLGGVEYGMKPLPIKKNAEWRKALVATLNEQGSTMQGEMTGLNSFMQGLMVAFFSFPEKVLGLVQMYAPKLPWEEILREPDATYPGVTDEEIVVAFSRIMVVAYPFTNLLGMMTVAAAQA